ncbi:MAG: DUF3368 domain-containing protein [Candidatus Zhuqueibacterota bacterium]
MIVVSNASPIINLAAIDRLHILKDLFEKIIIPDAVFEEIAIKGAGQPGANEVKNLKWIECQSVSNTTLKKVLQSDLDAGEAGAIALSMEVNADLLLIDEKIGRTIASQLGLKYIGVIGILIYAKSKGIIPEIKPVLDDLIFKAGFWIDQKLYDRVLHFGK